jgi:hypothetical protein
MGESDFMVFFLTFPPLVLTRNTIQFHLVCLGLDEPPAGDWLCPECTKARQASSKGGKERRGGGGAGGKAGQKVKVKR